MHDELLRSYLNMCTTIRRGFVEADKENFSGKALDKLYKAGEDLFFLLNRGYKIKGASTFVGNHYLLSERQRLAIVRGVSPNESLINRRGKEIRGNLKGSSVNIDGFNTIITLEVALSNSSIIRGMDNTIRDLAGLRGTYKIIDKTEEAIKLIGRILEEKEVEKAIFYLDYPVSNSGRLKEKIYDILKNYDFSTEVINISNVDSVLETLDNVISSDGIILDKCKSWINLNNIIINNYFGKCITVDFTSIKSYFL